MKPFKILSRTMVLDSEYCPIEEQFVELPDGTTTKWWINRSNDAVIVLPIMKDGRFVYQKNYKHGSGQVVYEIPAGLVDEKELPAKAAARELEEETGLVAEDMSFLGTVYANPTGSSMKYHFYVASGCTADGTQQLESAEQIEVFYCDSFKSLFNTLVSVDGNTSSATMACMAFYAQKTV